MNYNVSFAIVLLLFVVTSCNTTTTAVQQGNNADIIYTYRNEIEQHKKDLNTSYLDPNKSPLDKDQIKALKKEKGHKWFDINPALRIVGELDTTQIMRDIGFKTSTDRVAMYDRIGIVKFQINSKTYELSIYESHHLRNNPVYKDYLFLPFNDLTNGMTTYGGGRYIDVKREKDDKVVIDFNKAYNPYCAYSDKYSCPVPPVENFLNVEINAGIKLTDKEVK